MNKRNSGFVLLILTVLIAITLFASPVNREPLIKESGDSRIEA